MFFLFVDDDNVLNGYEGLYAFDGDVFTWKRFTQATTTIPTLSVTTALADLATAGLTEVLSETFSAGDSNVTVTVSTGATGAYRLQVSGSSIDSDKDQLILTAVQEGDNDQLAIIASGRSYDPVTFGYVFDNGTTQSGTLVTDAKIIFGAQLGDKYDDPCFCCTPVGCGC